MGYEVYTRDDTLFVTRNYSEDLVILLSLRQKLLQSQCFLSDTHFYFIEELAPFVLQAVTALEPLIEELADTVDAPVLRYEPTRSPQYPLH